MNHTNGSSTFLDRCLDNNFSALILVNESSIPPFAAKKALLVVFDKPKDPISYCQSQDTSGVVTITFGTHSDKNVKQVDPTLYGFFHSYGMLLFPLHVPSKFLWVILLIIWSCAALWVSVFSSFSNIC